MPEVVQAAPVDNDEDQSSRDEQRNKVLVVLVSSDCPQKDVFRVVGQVGREEHTIQSDH